MFFLWSILIELYLVVGGLMIHSVLKSQEISQQIAGDGRPNGGRVPWSYTVLQKRRRFVICVCRKEQVLAQFLLNQKTNINCICKFIKVIASMTKLSTYIQSISNFRFRGFCKTSLTIDYYFHAFILKFWFKKKLTSSRFFYVFFLWLNSNLWWFYFFDSVLFLLK